LALRPKVPPRRSLRMAALVRHGPNRAVSSSENNSEPRASGSALGILHGLPIPVKDSVNTKDLPTSNGTRALRDFKPRDDAAVLKPFFAQGAILMGKTNLHELSYGFTSNNAIFGPVRNPYDQKRVPGGSSGGSGAAVAARIAPSQLQRTRSVVTAAHPATVGDK
jgi:indoleacetamide hydrolase